MAKLTRLFHKIFGANANFSSQMSKYGSFKNGTPEYAADVAEIQSTPNFEEGLYASVVGNNSPIIQDINGVMHHTSRQVGYLLQQGIPEWDSSTTYYQNGFCSYDGKIYRSLLDNNLNKNPLTEVDYWVFASSAGGASLEPVELKSHMEKSGMLYPISNQSALNESFMNSTNVVITPRQSYFSGTQFHADVNKTDLDLMNATTGWSAGTGTPTIAQDLVNKIEGTASVKCTKLNLVGTMLMSKTFTAFTLLNSQLNLSLYLDTIANIERAFVTLSSSGGTRTYYIPVASLVATAWVHISIDPNLDTEDASTGTFDLNNITSISLGVSTLSSQTVNASWDFLTYQENYLLPVPCVGYIWDGTNQEEIKIESVLGSGNTQRNTYTITELLNSYAVGSSYIKQRNVLISGGSGQFDSGLSGAVSKIVYDITKVQLPENSQGKTLVMSQRFWDDEFKVSAIPSTTSLKLSSSVDKSGYFKSGDKVILYNKTWNGLKFESKYNTTMQSNFKVLTLTSDATFSSSEITLAFSGGDDSGADTRNWYVARYSAQMFYAVNSSGQNNSLVEAIPNKFKISTMNPSEFLDNFNRANGKFLNNWTERFYYAAGDGTPFFGIEGNSALARADSAASTYGYYSRPLPEDLPFEKEVTISNISRTGTSVTQEGSVGVCVWGGETDSFTGQILNTGLQVLLRYGGPNNWIFQIFKNTTLLLTTGVLVTGTTFGSFKVSFTPTRIKIKYWNGAEPSAWNITQDVVGFTPILRGFKLSWYAYSNQGGYNSTFTFDDISIVSKEGIGAMVSSTIFPVSGSEMVVATKLTRQDTTNQNPKIFQRDAILI